MAKVCTVSAKNITIEEIEYFNKNQQNIAAQNDRNGSESAFKKTLKGSKLFLKAQGFLSETEE